MNTQQLESFLAVAENLNFARAAESLNITQSAVSRQIHALEEELDTTLFRRTSRSVVLTLAGAIFYEDAKNFMHDLQIATSKIKYHSKSNVQMLTIGFSSDMNCILFTGLLKKCRQQFPELHPVLRVIPHRAILSLFFEGNIDILLGFKDDVPSRTGISYLELARTPICCAISSTHPLAAQTEVRAPELYTERIILCDSYSLPSEAANLQNKMKQHFLPESVYYCENPNVLLTLVKAGYGFGILPKININDSEVCAVPFVPEKEISFGLFYNENMPNPVVKDFLSILRKLKKEQDGQ